MLCCEWLPVRMTPLTQHSSVFNYSVISSPHGERGFKSIWRQEGGSLFTLVVVFCLFAAEQSWFKGLFLETKEAAGQTDVCLYLSKHTYQHILHRTNTSSRSCVLFSLRRQIVETPSPSPPSWGILHEQRQAGLFLPGMLSPGDPPSWLYSA